MKKTGLVAAIFALMVLPLTVHAALIGFNAEDGSSVTATVSTTLGAQFSARSDAGALGGSILIGSTAAARPRARRIG